MRRVVPQASEVVELTVRRSSLDYGVELLVPLRALPCDLGKDIQKGETPECESARQVLQPLEALGLEPPLPLVEARPVKAPLPARLRDVAELPGKLQDAQAVLRDLRRSIPWPGPLRCR